MVGRRKWCDAPSAKFCDRRRADPSLHFWLAFFINMHTSASGQKPARLCCESNFIFPKCEQENHGRDLHAGKERKICRHPSLSRCRRACSMTGRPSAVFARALAQNGFETFVVHYFERTGNRLRPRYGDSEEFRQLARIREQCGRLCKRASRNHRHRVIWLFVRRIPRARTRAHTIHESARWWNWPEQFRKITSPS